MSLILAGDGWRMPDDFWSCVAPLIPAPPDPKLHPLGCQRQRRDPRDVLDAILFVLRTGCHWKALDATLYGVSGSTAWRRFEEWTRAGVFARLWSDLLGDYDDEVGIDWQWLACDGAMTKAPRGGSATGDNPTDRAKSGAKRSLLTEAAGMPLAIVAAGANVNDHLLLGETIDQIVVDVPTPSALEARGRAPEVGLCLDKGYDYASTYTQLAELGWIGHVRSRGEEALDLRAIPGYRARRWVVERTHSWLNRFRRLLVRWERKVANHLGFLQLACAVIVWRSLPSKRAAY